MSRTRSPRISTTFSITRGLFGRDPRRTRFFLTGGTGFVGTWLPESLLWANGRMDLGVSAVAADARPGQLHRAFAAPGRIIRR